MEFSLRILFENIIFQSIKKWSFNLDAKIRFFLDTHQILTKYQTCRSFPSGRSYVWVVVLLVVTGGKQSQLLLKPTKVELGLQVRVEFDKNFPLIHQKFLGRIISPLEYQWKLGDPSYIENSK